MFDKLVVTSDNRRLGRCKNVIMNANTKHADLFVMPESILNKTNSKLFRDQKGSIVGTAGHVGGHEVGHKAMHSVPHQVTELVHESSLDFVTDLPGGFLGAMLGNWIHRTIRSIEESYYLIPISHIDLMYEDMITLEIDLELSRKWFMNIIITPDHKPFYPFDKHVLSRLKIIGSSSFEKPLVDELQQESGTKTKKDLEIDSLNDVASIILRNIEKLTGH